ncbi:MAG: hypothetical protein V2A63_01970 [Patescibacteria group bacterium]
MTRKLFTLLLAGIILAGCETINSAVEDAQNLQASVVTKVAEVKAGIENVVNKTQDAYATLVEKKKQLEDTIAQINAAIEAANKLLGKEDEGAKNAELQQTVAGLQASLAEAQQALAAANATEGQTETNQ